MRTLAILAAVVTVGSVPAEEPPRFVVVENKVPAFKVVENRVPKKAEVKWVAYSRPPVGHTHTCPRCHVVWDHQENPTHACANCGTQQFVQDPFPRPVTLWRQVPAERPDPVPVPSLSDDCPTGH
jgi:hypothetical protein